jgi:hypothetical protein
VIVIIFLAVSTFVLWQTIEEYFHPFTRHFPTMWETGAAFRYLGAVAIAVASSLGIYFRVSLARIGVVATILLVAVAGFREIYNLHKYSPDIFEIMLTTPKGWSYTFLTTILPVLLAAAMAYYLYGARTRAYFRKTGAANC